MADVIPLFQFDQPAAQPAGEVPLASATMRNNLNAIGRLNWTTNASYPLNPREGMPRILDLNGLGTNIRLQIWRAGVWQTLVSHLELILSLAARIEFNFAIATNPWTIDHNLGVRPLIQTFNTTDNLIVPTDIQHVQVGGEWNRVIVTHAGNQAGYAILIG